MAIKWDKEKTILSIAGGLVTLILGYLIWRHENAVQVSEQQQQENAEAANDAQLQQEIAALPSYTNGGGASDDSGDSGSDSNVESPPTDSEISAILQAFFPNGTSGTTTTTPPSTPSAPSTPVGTPSGTPTAPTSPSGGTVSQIPGGAPVFTGGSGASGALPVATPEPIITRANPEPIITRPTTSQFHPVG